MPTTVVIGSNCFTGAHIVDALLDDPSQRVVGISRSPQYKPIYLPYARHVMDCGGCDAALACGGAALAPRKAKAVSQPPHSIADRFTFHQLDITNEFARLAQLLDTLQPEVVIHVAALSEVALSTERPIEYFQTNTTAVARLCDHLRRQRYLRHYVHISSAELFGSCRGAVDESHPFNPSTPYAVSKAAADMFINTLIRHFNFPAILIRSTNVYGRHQQLFKIIPRTAIYLKLGRTIELHGGGTSVKNFIHIRDVVRGLMLALQRGEPGTYHLSVPSDDTVADVVRLVCRQMGRDPDAATRVVGERLGQDARYWLDCGKAKRELGWSPQVAFADGVQETIDWIESQWETIQHEPLNYEHKPLATGTTS
ncbi:MAG: GDP-mannose 4,6-dehydratase [Phycisphaeraceae bacterium]